MPPNLDIDNQPVSGVKKPFQQQQTQMAQPFNMAQVPPMANPPIKEQPIYRPPTMPPPQIPDGKFSSGLGVAILALLPCCGINLLAIIAIVLSAIASGEFKKGDIAKAQKHAKLSKTFSTLAFIIGIIFWIMLISSIKTTLDEENNQDQQTIIEEIEENQ